MISWHQSWTSAKRFALPQMRELILTLYCGGRSGIADTGKLVARGAFGNLPAGEAMVAPIETKGRRQTGGRRRHRRLQGHGRASDDHLQGRRIVKTEGPDAEDFDKFVAQFDDTAKNVCEFGIGTNPSCRIMGNGLVDERSSAPSTSLAETTCSWADSRTAICTMT